MDGLLVVDFAQLQEMQLQAVAEEQSALAIAYLKDIVAVFERGEESAFCDRDDYAFLHSIIVFADLQCRIDEPAAVEKRTILVKLQVTCLHFDI